MSAPMAETTAGKIRGRLENGVYAFLGVPYGMAARFQAPQPPRPWPGVRDALEYGPTAPQPERRADQPSVSGNPAIRQREECLVLNVWTKGLGDGAKRPIMVWIHGGGFSTGSGSRPGCHGAALAVHGDVVVITVNHRLGATGHLYLKGIDGDRFRTSGINSFLDLVLALEWVRDNAAAFGGDASRMMIFGLSGGGGKVATLMAMPSARGLFHVAAIQSGIKNNAERPVSTVFGMQAITPDDAELVRSRVLEQLGLTPARAAELVDVPIEKLVAAQGTVEAGGLVFGPVLDEKYLPNHPFDPVACEGSRDIPLLIGSQEDEWANYVAARPVYKELDFDGVVRWLADWSVGDAALGVTAEYRRLLPLASPQELLVAAVSDLLIKVPSVRVADRRARDGSAPVYSYLFTWDAPTGHAFHALETPFIFRNRKRVDITGTDLAPDALSESASGAWLSFARSGDPNHEGLPEWSAYTPEGRPTMILDLQCRLEHDPLADRLRIWDDAI